MSFHLKCFGDETDGDRICKLCFTPTLDHSYMNDSCTIDSLLPKELQDMVKYRGIKLVHQNICSLLRRLDELRLMCNVLKSSIHMITLSETWLTSEIPDIEIEIDGYRVFRKDRDSRGGGVLAYVRNDLFVVRRADLETPSVEGMWLEISLPKARGFLVGIFYRPPDSSAYHDKDFMLKLDDMLDMALEQDREVIITGDFNCDFMAKREVDECRWLKHIRV